MRRTTALVTAATLVLGLTACDRKHPRSPTPADAGSVVKHWTENGTGFVSVRLDDGRRVTRALDRPSHCPPGSKYPVCDT